MSIFKTYDYSVAIHATEIRPLGRFNYEAKATRIFDQRTQREVPLTPENTCINWGVGAAEAKAKVREDVERWAALERRKVDGS